jgi:hypothetical protein
MVTILFNLDQRWLQLALHSVFFSSTLPGHARRAKYQICIMSHHGAATAWQHEADLAQLARPRAQPVELLGRSLHPAAYQQPEMPRLPGPTIVPARYLHAQPCVSSRPQSFSRRTHVIISDLTRLLAWIAAPHLRAEPTCMTCRQNL